MTTRLVRNLSAVTVAAGPRAGGTGRGAFSARGPVYYDTTISASYESAKDSVRVGTHVRIVTSLSGSYRSSGGYRLVHAGTRPVHSLGAAPTKADHHVTARLQVKSGGHWRTVDSRSYKIGDKSTVELPFSGLAGRKFRIRTEYEADTSNLGRNSRHLYVRFV